MNVRYIQHDEGSKTTHNLDVKTLDYCQHKKLYHSLKGEESQMLDVDFGSNLETMRSYYLDMYDGVHANIVYTNRFDENSDLSTTYLGKIKMTRETKVKAEEKFPISGQGYTLGKLLDNTDCQIQLDMSTLPKCASNTQVIQVRNGQYVGVLSVILVIVYIDGHTFEIFTLVSEIPENVNLVLGIKNIFELEGVIDSQDSCFSFLNRFFTFFPKSKGRN